MTVLTFPEFIAEVKRCLPAMANLPETPPESRDYFKDAELEGEAAEYTALDYRPGHNPISCQYSTRTTFPWRLKLGLQLFEGYSLEEAWGKAWNPPESEVFVYPLGGLIQED